MSLSLPPLPLGWLAWLGLLPLFYALRAQSYRGGFGIGYRAGLIYHLGSLYWILLNTGATPILRVLSLVGMLIILPLGWGVSAWLIATMRRRWGMGSWLLAPFVWAAAEMLFSIGESGFPWAILALSQSRFLDLIQTAELTGVHGVTFWVVAGNAFLMIAWQESRTKGKVAVMLLVVLLWILLPASWGRHRRADLPPAVGTINVGLVQGDIPPEEKWKRGVEYSLTPYEALTDSIACDSLQLVVWPETAVPTYLEKRWQYRKSVQDYVDSLRIPILTGANDYEITPEGEAKTFNAAFLVMPDSTELHGYHKIHPVPFGERIPFQRYVPFLGSFNLGQAEFTPGSNYTVFSLGNGKGKFSVLICFESIFSYVTRNFVRHGAEFLVNITNDGWFGRCSEPYQHLQLTRFRSIEARRWLVRAANTGISAVISADGTITEYLPLLHRGAMVQTIELRQDQTFFVRHGNWFPLLCGACSIVFVLGLIFYKRKDFRR
jgi:apolipoprotein N-acyltransferase